MVVGAKTKRKNVAGLIEAFKLLDEPLQERFKIVLTGADFDLSPRSQAQPTIHHQFRLCKRWFVTGTVFPCQLAVVGSLAEGFGLPMVEAMRASCVVLASNVFCMPEILGDAGIYCDPYNPIDIAKRLEIALTPMKLYAKSVSPKA
ncbi:hypothetical protein HHE014_05960 [Helicobacter heilmannii]|nr:hypothetical protein ASB1_12540 [Helicobacter heilmannii]CRF45630.1 hypothetical protein HHE014_05960 [Helicobacter heilmannii]